MKISFTLEEKPYSLNTYFYKNGKIKRQSTIKWENRILAELSKDSTQEMLSSLSSEFDPEKHEIHVEFLFYFPKSILYTKKGTLSSRAFDLSNMEKPLLDIIFLEKYCKSYCTNLKIDDKYVTSLLSRKISTEKTHKIEVNISLHPICI